MNSIEKKEYPIVTLCGSMKYYNIIQRHAELLEREGFIVLKPTKTDKDVEMTLDYQITLAKMHYKKIDISDAIIVINEDDYIGMSTLCEIIYAKQIDIPIYFLNTPQDYGVIQILNHLGVCYNRVELSKLIDIRSVKSQDDDPSKTE